jgi:hypothetical protein
MIPPTTPPPVRPSELRQKLPITSRAVSLDRKGMFIQQEKVTP